LEFDHEVMSVGDAHEVSLRSPAHPADVLDCVQFGTHWIELAVGVKA
jgi:hypothetical protein